jgi:hypothetical protein
MAKSSDKLNEKMIEKVTGATPELAKFIFTAIKDIDSRNGLKVGDRREDLKGT